MIICPNCKEEIDDDSRYCDQCGQALLYCNRCGRVGMGRRCTYCGGLMVASDEYQRGVNSQTALSSLSGGKTTDAQASAPSLSVIGDTERPSMPQGVPILTLSNDMLNIHLQGINGAVIGRKQGPYAQFFRQNMYVSGVHAQLKYKVGVGWCITDKHSSNGTKLNEHPLQPDVDMVINSGDVVSVANVILQVAIK